MPYRSVFDVVWSGRRHIMMMASQIDRSGNQNISAIGDHAHPKVQLVGVRGAPGNSVNHPTSYWVPDHSARMFVDQVDVVSGVGYERAAVAGPGATRFHDVRRVVSNLGVFDFETPGRIMRLRSHHPGVAVDDIVAVTGFELSIPEDVAETRLPTPEELELVRDVLDPASLRDREQYATYEERYVLLAALTVTLAEPPGATVTLWSERLREKFWLVTAAAGTRLANTLVVLPPAGKLGWLPPPAVR